MTTSLFESTLSSWVLLHKLNLNKDIMVLSRWNLNCDFGSFFFLTLFHVYSMFLSPSKLLPQFLLSDFPMEMEVALI